jgi:hypothetical protein
MRHSHVMQAPGSGFGGLPGHSIDDDYEEIFPEPDYEHAKTLFDDPSFIHLHHLVSILEEKMEHEGISSKNHKIQTPAPEKPGKRKYVLKHGEKILESIPLQTKAMADFVNDPLVPHAYLVKTA